MCAAGGQLGKLLISLKKKNLTFRITFCSAGHSLNCLTPETTQLSTTDTQTQEYSTDNTIGCVYWVRTLLNSFVFFCAKPFHTLPHTSLRSRNRLRLKRARILNQAGLTPKTVACDILEIQVLRLCFPGWSCALAGEIIGREMIPEGFHVGLVPRQNNRTPRG